MRAGTDQSIIEEAYDEHVWGAAKDYIFEQNNAFIILWCMELFGYEVEQKRWLDLASYAEKYTNDYFTPYLTVTAILAVAKVSMNRALNYRSDLQQYINEFKQSLCEESKNKYEQAWLYTALPILDRCLAYLQGEYKSALALLAASSEAETRLMGHSNEQRSIFKLTRDFCLSMTC